MNLLMAIAHPDDETVFGGGTLAMLSEKGVQIHLLSATRGEGGEVGEPPLCRPSELGEVREQELRCAAAALGIQSVTFLDYVDPNISGNGQLNAFHADLETLSSQIRSQMKLHQAQVILSHGSEGEYGHPAHILMHQAVLKAVKTERLTLYTFSANFEGHPRARLANKHDPADFILFIEPWFPQKLAGALCHRSQNALFVRRQSSEAGRPLSVAEVMLKVESLHRAWPVECDHELDPLAQFLIDHCHEACKIENQLRRTIYTATH